MRPFSHDSRPLCTKYEHGNRFVRTGMLALIHEDQYVLGTSIIGFLVAKCPNVRILRHFTGQGFRNTTFVKLEHLKVYSVPSSHEMEALSVFVVRHKVTLKWLKLESLGHWTDGNLLARNHDASNYARTFIGLLKKCPKLTCLSIERIAFQLGCLIAHYKERFFVQSKRCLKNNLILMSNMFNVTLVLQI